MVIYGMWDMESVCKESWKFEEGEKEGRKEKRGGVEREREGNSWRRSFHLQGENSLL
jgi:hypothetical protein